VESPSQQESKRIGVHVIISGIVSIIPGSDKVVIRLQDARTTAGGHHGGHLEAHFPSVVAELPLVHWDGAHKPDVTARQNGARSLAGWRLDYEAPAAIEVKNGKLGPGPSLDRSSLLPIAAACPGKTCARAKASPRGMELVADRGFLAASSLEPKRWRWQGTTTDQLDIAEEVCWSFWIEDPPLVLVLPSGAGKTWSLEIDPPGDGGDIEVRIQNVPEADIIPGFIAADAVPADTAATASLDEDHHAALYFEESLSAPKPPPILQSDGTPPEQPLPPSGHRLEGRRIAERVSASGIGILSIRVNCPPALWEGF
jgi:hypothetical protein